MWYGVTGWLNRLINDDESLVWLPIGSTVDYARSHGWYADVTRPHGWDANVTRPHGWDANVTKPHGWYANVVRPHGWYADVTRSYGWYANVVRSYGWYANVVIPDAAAYVLATGWSAFVVIITNIINTNKPIQPNESNTNGSWTHS